MRSFLLLSLVALSGYFLSLSLANGGSVEGPREGGQENNEEFRKQIYDVYMKLHNRTWREEELPKRVENFWRHRQMILESIKNFTEGRSSYVMKENDFMDMDEEEIKKFGVGLNPPSREELERELQEGRSSMPQFGNGPSLPGHVDWRDTGCIYEPYTQGSCGSCSMTATAGALQALRCIRLGHERAPTLSFQQLLDCATQDAGYNNIGCGGGWPRESLRYLKDVGVHAKQDCYPNLQHQEHCRLQEMSNDCVVSSSPTDGTLQYHLIQGEQAIAEAVANVGPVMVFIERSERMLYYGGGIFEGEDCGGRWEDMDHVVVAVGYGSENGKDYWILKNSYGPEWGDNGFIKLRRNTNACSIAHYAVVVTE